MAEPTHTSLFEDFEYFGNWWQPSQPEFRVPGQLVFEAGNSISVVLTGAFVDFIGLQDFRTEVLHGLTTEGYRCTLDGFLGGGSSTNFTNDGIQATSQVLRFRYLLVGDHVNPLDDLKIVTYETSFVSLEEWVADRTIFTEVGDKFITSGRFERPAPRIMPLPKATGQVELDYAAKTSARALDFTVSAEPVFRFRPSSTARVFDAHQVMIEVERLWVLLMGHRSTAKYIALTTEDDEHKAKYLFHCDRPTDYPNIKQFRMMLRMPQVEEQLASALLAWFDNATDLGRVYSLLLGYIHRPDVFVEFGFLALFQALEAYHRTRHKGTYASREEYEPTRGLLIDAIPDDLSPDWKRALKARLRYGNEYSQRKRLTELVEGLPVSYLNLLTVDAKTLVNSIVDMRNSLTHPDKDTEHIANDIPRLIELSGRLRALLTIILLTECGLDTTTVHLAIRQLNDRILPRAHR